MSVYRSKRSCLFLLPLVVVAAACDPGTGEPDAGPCDLGVRVGTMQSGAFVPASDGDPTELILGFQGFRMLRFALEVEGASETQAEVSAFVGIPDTGVELSQRTRETALSPTASGFLIEDWLVFFNDEPPSRVVDQNAEIEVIVRAGGCVGGTRALVAVRDEDPCVDTTIVLDAGSLDAGVGPDASVCAAGP